MASHTVTRHHQDGRLDPIREEFAGLKDTVQSGLNETAASGKRLAGAAKDVAMDTVAGFRDSAGQTLERVTGRVKERPLTSLAIAAGVGAALMGMYLMWRRR